MEKEIVTQGYMTYREAAIMFSLMDDLAAAQAIKATVNYFLSGEEAKLEGPAAAVFAVMKKSVDQSHSRYREITVRNRENGKKGGRPKRTPA